MYLELLRRWITLQIRREDFEVEARTLMRPDEVALHNDYLMELLLTLSKAPVSASSTTMAAVDSSSPKISLTPTVSSTNTAHHVSSDNPMHPRVKPVFKNLTASSLSYTSKSPPYSSCSKEESTEEVVNSPGKAASSDSTRSPVNVSKQRKRRPAESLQPPAINRAEHAFGLFMPESNATPTLDNQLTMPNVVSFVVSVPQAEMPAPHCSFLMREQAFPESALLYGRMLVVAYEHGLDDIDAPTVELMLQALRSQLFRVIAAMVDRRVACSRRKLTRLGNGIASRAPNPYLGAAVPFHTNHCCDFLESAQVVNEFSAPSAWDVENSSMCSLFDLVDALRTDRRLICSHTVYTLTMERALLGLRHASHEQLESEYIFSQQKTLSQQILKQQLHQHKQQNGLTGGSGHSRPFGSPVGENLSQQITHC
ncbi:uncharacterized protein LOC111258836 isoform X2 [Varroa jacobsoni]|nr:uncharacterized protein LOC111258836 isoform X2 [Varroa jacobsoni]